MELEIINTLGLLSNGDILENILLQPKRCFGFKPIQLHEYLDAVSIVEEEYPNSNLEEKMEYIDSLLFEGNKSLIIYYTRNLINWKGYVGQHATNNLKDNYLGSGRILQKAIKKYGKENFESGILEICSSREILNEREKYWIKYFRDKGHILYNISEGGSGKEHIQETKNKISKSLSGVNHPMYGRKGIINHNFGKKRSKEVCERISKGSTGKRIGILNPNYGKKASEETLLKLRNSHLGKTLSESAKKKVSEFQTGRVRSEETRKKLSEINKGKKHSEETKKKLSEFWKGKRSGVNSVWYGKKLSEEHVKHAKETRERNKANMDFIVCPYCNKESKSLYLMNRYHFGNCKKKNG